MRSVILLINGYDDDDDVYWSQSKTFLVTAISNKLTPVGLYTSIRSRPNGRPSLASDMIALHKLFRAID